MRRRALVALAALVAAAGIGVAVVGAAAPGGADEDAAPAAPPEFRIIGARVSPRHAYFAGRPVALEFAVAAPEPLDLQIDVVRDRTGQPVRRLLLSAAPPAVAQRVEWDGVTGGGKVAPDGGYRIRIRGPDGRVRRGGTFTLRSHP